MGLEEVKRKTVAKVGVAHLRPPCLQMGNISTCPWSNPLRFLIFDSETADEPFSYAKQAENVLTSQPFVILIFVKCVICILCFTHSKC